MTISTQRLRFLRGNTAASSAFTGLQGELIIDTDLRTIRVQDGTTAGGVLLATAAQLANVATTGNLTISGQTISGTIANANIGLIPSGKGSIIFDVGSNSSARTYLYIDSTTANVVSAHTINGQSLKLNANATIVLDSATNHIGFNTGPNPGYTYAFNSGSLYSREFYADANFPTGYQFTTPQGLTGLGHSYQNDSQGNISMVRISHDSNTVARFYENLTTTLSGNLTVTQNGNTFGTFPNAYVQVYSNVNSYSQIIGQNLNNGNKSSTDFVATADNGTDSTRYIDLGINSSTYADPAFFGDVGSKNDGYLYVVNTSQAGPYTGNGNLILGSTNGQIKFFVGNTANANVIATMTNVGLIPGANVTYSLGSSTKQWKDLWLSNNTMYLGGFPITVTANGVLQVNSIPVSSSTYANANVASYLPTYTGNIAGNIVKNGYSWTFGTSGALTLPAGGTITGLGGLPIAVQAPPGNQAILENNAGYNSVIAQDQDVRVVTSPDSGTTFYTWNFDTVGNLNVPGNILFTSSPAGVISGASSISTGLLTASGNATVGNLNLSGIGASGKLQFKAAAGTNGAYIYDSSGSVFLAPNTTYSATAGVTIGGLGYLLSPNGSRNITLNYNSVNGQVGVQTNLVVGTTSSGGNLTVANSIVASGNISGTYFIGNGALLTGIAASSSYGNTNVASYLASNSALPIVTTSNITAGYFIGNGALLTGLAASSSYGNTNVASYLASNSNITITTTGNITGANIITSGSFVVANIVTTGAYGNISGANVITANTLVANGNVTGTYFVGNGAFLTGLTASSNYGNANVASYLPTYTGNITAGNILSDNHLYANGVSILAGITGNYGNTNVATYLSGSVSVGNLTANTNVTVTSNLIVGSGSGGFLFRPLVGGSGATIYGLGAAPSQTNYALSYNGASLNLNAPTGGGIYSSIQNSIVTSLTSTGLAVTGVLTATGNITGNNIVANSFTYANGVNILTGIGSTYSNANVASYLPTYSGNLTAGNILSNNYLYANGVNILTGVASNYGNTNVAAYLPTYTGNIASGNISTGNITANYFIGNGSTLTGLVYNNIGNIYGSSSNVTLQAGSYSWTFDNTGNLVIPTTSNIVYANGAIFTSGGGTGNYANTNVAAYLASNSNILITTTGNITGNYFIGNGALLTGISAGSSYSNANVVSMLAANTAIFIGNTGVIGNVATGNIQANATAIFLGGNTVISNYGSPTFGYASHIGNNIYFDANGVQRYRNTQTGASDLIVGPGSLYWYASGGAVTANAATGWTGATGAYMAISTSGMSLYNGAGITSAGYITIQSATGLVTNQATVGLFQNASTIAAGTASGVLVIGSGGGNVTVGNGIVSSGNSPLTIRGRGTYNTLTLASAQGGYNSPPYSNVALTGGSGTGMTASWSSVGGYVNGAVTVINPGSGYKNGDTLTLPGGIGSTVILSNYNSSISNGTTVGQADYTFGIDGNLTLPGNVTHVANTAIYGDFSNNTVNYRTIFKTTTANSTTGIYAVPNGTSTGAAWQAVNSSNLTNASKIMITTNGNTDVQLVSGINGSGTYLPLSFYTNGAAQMQLDTGGNLSMVTGGNINTTGNIYGGNIIATQFGNSTGTTATYTGNVTSGNLITSGYGQFTGSFNESTTIAGVFVGNTGSGTPSPRIGFFNGNTTQNWQIDNYGGSFRWFTPGTTRMSLDPSGNLTVLGTLTANTDATITGNLTINGINAGYAPNRPGFRVSGNGGAITGNTIVSGGYLSVDFNQGGYLNTSTGYFTAPVAGLYQVNLVTRTNSNSSNNIIQSIIQKTSGATTTNIIMIEYGPNTSMNHTGGSTVVKLAVGDTLRFNVAVGTISFDGNDNWSVAYLG